HPLLRPGPRVGRGGGDRPAAHVLGRAPYRRPRVRRPGPVRVRGGRARRGPPHPREPARHPARGAAVRPAGADRVHATHRRDLAPRRGGRGGLMGGIYLEDLEVGREVVTGRPTLTEADVAAFAGLSWDVNPLHTDELWVSENTPFRGRIAHGLLVLAMSSGLRSELDDVQSIAYLEVQRRFEGPAYPGDTI